jgi:hypothetical protein
MHASDVACGRARLSSDRSGKRLSRPLRRAARQPSPSISQPALSGSCGTKRVSVAAGATWSNTPRVCGSQRAVRLRVVAGRGSRRRDRPLVARPSARLWHPPAHQQAGGLHARELRSRAVGIHRDAGYHQLRRRGPPELGEQCEQTPTGRLGEQTVAAAAHGERSARRTASTSSSAASGGSAASIRPNTSRSSSRT